MWQDTIPTVEQVRGQRRWWMQDASGTTLEVLAVCEPRGSSPSGEPLYFEVDGERLPEDTAVVAINVDSGVFWHPLQWRHSRCKFAPCVPPSDAPGLSPGELVVWGGALNAMLARIADRAPNTSDLARCAQAADYAHGVVRALRHTARAAREAVVAGHAPEQVRETLAMLLEVIGPGETS